jgi:hypothetical protein
VEEATLAFLTASWRCSRRRQYVNMRLLGGPRLFGLRSHMIYKLFIYFSLLVFLVITPRRFLGSYQIFGEHTVSILVPENGDMFLKNVGIYKQVHMVLQLRRQTLTSSSQWEHKFSHFIYVFKPVLVNACSEAKALIAWKLRSWVWVPMKKWTFVLVFLCCVAPCI